MTVRHTPNHFPTPDRSATGLKEQQVTPTSDTTSDTTNENSAQPDASPTPPPASTVEATIAATTAPSLVGIGRNWRGVGLVVAPDRVLTNAHNLRDRTTLITFADGEASQSTVIAVDHQRDLAVLEVDTGSRPSIEFADGELTWGSPAIAAVPTPAGLRITSGTVSNPSRSIRGRAGRSIDAVIEHTAPLARGSSGSALFDVSGRAVGFNTHRLGRGFYAAQRTDDSFRAILDRLVEGTSTEPPRLGVEVAPKEVAHRLRTSVGLEPADGLLVRAVHQPSPAHDAGFREGDLIVSVGGRPTPDADSLHRALGEADPTQSLAVSIVRGADELDLAVSFAASSDESNANDDED